MDERLYAVEVRDAGQLDKDLVVTEAILLNDGLADAKGVDAVANHFNRVLDGPLVERLLDVRLHCDVQRVIAPAADVILARVLAVDERLYRAGLRGVNSFDLNLLRVGRIRLGDLRKGQFRRLEILFNPSDGVVGFGIDSLFNLDLQNQVNAALKVQSKMDVLCQLREQWLSAAKPGCIESEESAVKKYDQHSDDDHDLLFEILLHCSNSLVQIAVDFTTFR